MTCCGCMMRVFGEQEGVGEAWGILAAAPMTPCAGMAPCDMRDVMGGRALSAVPGAKCKTPPRRLQIAEEGEENRNASRAEAHKVWYRSMQHLPSRQNWWEGQLTYSELPLKFHKTSSAGLLCWTYIPNIA